ncbi:PTS glucose transporter subunit IIBC [Gynuella sp.]|uniref:PTS glucose transporter subunit IIBC n=1 Tax=Gynuella sp. TaxID=2969146 RepID=UPI003D0E04C6
MSVWKQSFAVLQKVGKSLMLPVSVLPVAGILLGIGGADWSHLGEVPQLLALILSVMKQSGDAVFGNLPLIFAIGVALGFTNNDGVSALAATVGYYVMTAAMKAMGPTIAGSIYHIDLQTNPELIDKLINTGVLGGIVAGGIAAFMFNRFFNIKLPTYLGFFAGKRFVPIITAFGAIVAAVILTIIWPPIGNLINSFSDWAAYQNPALAFGIYGVVERSLIPFGLHHIWNVPFFFEAGAVCQVGHDLINGVADKAACTAQGGQWITGEIQRYLAGDPTAGNMAGGYLFKMWGLPAAAIAMWHTAKPENRVKIGGIMVSAALTSFLTGITEPIEFAFLFVAPVLYVIHAILAGLAFPITILLDMKHGMTFSHGGIDFFLFSHLSHNFLMFFVVGPAYALVYYTVFRVAIVKLDLKTPGREDEVALVSVQTTTGNVADDDRVGQIILAFGGASNLKTVDNCITRLRMEVHQTDKVNADRLKALGATGVIKVGNGIQAIFGTEADNLRTSIDQYLASGKAPELDAPMAAPVSQAAAAPVAQQSTVAGVSDEQRSLANRLITLLGGKDNIQDCLACATSRLRLELKDQVKWDEAELRNAGVKRVMRINETVVHLLLGDQASATEQAMKEQLAG